MKQVIDLNIDERLDARDVQERVSRLFQQRLIPLLENYLDHLDSPAGTTQIPLLEIDLGVLAIDNLEELFEDSFEKEIATLIKETSGGYTNDTGTEDAEVVTESQTDLVLVACFLETGTFPWWIKDGTTTLFRLALTNVIKAETHEPIRLLRVLLAEQAAIKRLVYNAGDQLLREIATIASAYSPAVRDAMDEIAMQRIYQAYKKTLSTPAFREIWWTDLFTLTLHKPWVKDREAPRLIRLLLTPEGGFEPHDNKTGNGQSLLSHYKKLLWILNKLLPVFAPAALQKEVPKQNLPALQEYFNVMRALFGLEKGDDDTGNDPTLLSKDDAGYTPNKPGEKPGGNDDNTDNTPSLFSKKDAGFTSNKPAEKQDFPGESAGPSDNGYPVAAEKTRIPPHQANFNQSPVNSTFSDVEKLYIQNSGLVLLWPFLPRFFNNLALIKDDKQFADADAAAKACLLLQYLAYGNDLEMFEPLLPLNKLLSGINLFDPVDIQAELTQDERDAADHMLRSVINNAPLWKTLSEDGLRRAYLQREGILSARDGQWLLQVKRETYDVILDKLPWAVSVVKLPWMENLIFVEWLSI